MLLFFEMSIEKSGAYIPVITDFEADALIGSRIINDAELLNEGAYIRRGRLILTYQQDTDLRAENSLIVGPETETEEDFLIRGQDLSEYGRAIGARRHQPTRAWNAITSSGRRARSSHLPGLYRQPQFETAGIKFAHIDDGTPHGDLAVSGLSLLRALRRDKIRGLDGVGVGTTNFLEQFVEYKLNTNPEATDRINDMIVVQRIAAEQDAKQQQARKDAPPLTPIKEVPRQPHMPELQEGDSWVNMSHIRAHARKGQWHGALEMAVMDAFRLNHYSSRRDEQVISILDEIPLVVVDVLEEGKLSGRAFSVYSLAQTLQQNKAQLMKLPRIGDKAVAFMESFVADAVSG